MSNKKISKAINQIVIVIFTMMIICNTFVAMDYRHLEECHEAFCAKCDILCHAQNILKIFIGSIIFIMAIHLFNKIIFKLYNQSYLNKSNTLISIKVQFNE